MGESVRLFRVRGIPVGVNWSLLVVFALVALGLAGGRFPAAYPDHQPAVYLLAGFVTALLFFASVLAHELGHALLAQARGVEVEGITLWLFGGVARFAGEAENPRDELRIAAVGPLVSLVAGAVFFVAREVLLAAGAADIAVGMMTWLAIINVVLAVFNMVPAAPLDGGRVLRALLWRRHGDRRRAAATAARAGQFFGLALVGLGVVEFAFGAGLGGIWFMLLGWFLLTAARTEATHSRLHGIRVRDVMTQEPVTVPDWLTVSAFVDDYLFKHRFSTFPARGFDGRPTGVLTLRAVKGLRPERRPETRVREIMCPLERVPAVRPDDELADVLPRLAVGCSDGRALVMVEGEVVGIVSPTDIARVADLADLRDARRQPHMT